MAWRKIVFVLHKAIDLVFDILSISCAVKSPSGKFHSTLLLAT